jgi:hypothetical protein
MNLKEQLNRTKSLMGLLNEETEGIDSFIDKIITTFPKTKDYIDSIKSFIDNSGCKKIEVAKFKYPAFGLALHNGVVFNETIFNNSLPNFLFIMCHEIAHQYQYQKYGNEKMYEFYLGEIDVKEAAIAMKQIEMTADEFAERKVREFVKLGLLNSNEVSMFNGFYKRAPLMYFEKLITQIKEKIKESGVTDFDGISTIFYNMIKANI